MEKRFVAPAMIMLAGLIMWIVFLVLHLSSEGLSLNIAVIFTLIVGSMIALSGIICKRAGGPRLGNIVRTSLLLVLALITYWQIHAISALILFAAACITGALALNSTPPTD